MCTWLRPLWGGWANVLISCSASNLLRGSSFLPSIPSRHLLVSQLLHTAETKLLVVVVVRDCARRIRVVFFLMLQERTRQWLPTTHPRPVTGLRNSHTIVRVPIQSSVHGCQCGSCGSLSRPATFLVSLRSIRVVGCSYSFDARDAFGDARSGATTLVIGGSHSCKSPSLGSLQSCLRSPSKLKFIASSALYCGSLLAVRATLATGEGLARWSGLDGCTGFET